MNKRKKYIIISLFFALLTILPIEHVEAKNSNLNINNIVIKRMDPSNENNNANADETKESVSECESVLGDVNREESVAWLLQKILNYIKILGPTIAVVMGSLDFTKAIISSDEDGMKKSQKRFINRLIAAVILFFIPLLVEIMLSFLGITTNNASCGLN